MRRPIIGTLRWLEPIGQATALVAFGLQFFVVDPATSDILLRTVQSQSLNVETYLRIDKIPTPPTDPDEVDKALTDLERGTALIRGMAESYQLRARFRPLLFVLFLVGGLMTITGKSASIIYGTKRG